MSKPATAAPAAAAAPAAPAAKPAAAPRPAPARSAGVSGLDVGLAFAVALLAIAAVAVQYWFVAQTNS
jgi:hypothetical protein